jgi:LPS-assembly protein
MASYYAIQSKPDSATTDTGELGQVNPSISLGARAPLVVSAFDRTAIIEPQAQFVWVGGADRTENVPNRDAADYRIDEANLFLLNRYQGKDYVLPGARADAGISTIANDKTVGEIAGFIGVSRRVSGKPSSGLAPDQGDVLSDYVASLSLNPPQNVSLSWSGRLSSHDFTLNESKTQLNAKLGKLSLSVSHNQLAKAYFANSTSDREELVIGAGLPLGSGWTASASRNWDLSNGKEENKTTSASLVWNGGVQDCMQIRIDYSHDATKDRDISRADEIKFTFAFKYLGSITQDDIVTYSGAGDDGS